MKMVKRLFSTSVLAVMLFGAAASARPVAQVESIPGSMSIGDQRFGTLRASSACALGVTGPAAWRVNYILPPNDAYYTFLNPGACSTCTGVAGVIATTAHVALSFGYMCTQPVTVAVYGAQGSPGCYQPDLGTVYAAPTTHNLTPPATGIYEFSMPLPPGACFSGPAFLMVMFPVDGAACDSAATRPRLVTADGCMPCTTWNIYAVGGPDDLCDPLIGFPGNPMMWVDADCCSVVPALPGSWGKLKLLYR